MKVKLIAKIIKAVKLYRVFKGSKLSRKAQIVILHRRVSELEEALINQMATTEYYQALSRKQAEQLKGEL